MGDLTKNISRWEVACKCGTCDKDNLSRGVLNIVQMVRDHFGKPVSIHSAIRCKNHNKKIGGKENSQHITGNAIDFHVVDVSIDEVYSFLDGLFPNSLGLGKYETFVHVDDRCDRAYRW